MKRLVIVAALLVLVFVISGCSLNTECKKPFIGSEGNCCLDLDDNGVCDEKQGEEKAAEPSTPAEETKTAVEEKKETPPAETQEAPAEIKEEPKAEEQEETKEAEEEKNETTSAPAPKNITISEEDKTVIEKLLETFAQKVNSYKYSYKATWYYVRGDKMRAKLRSAVPVTGVSAGGQYFSLFYYDNVYMNKKEKTAFGYCEGTDVRLGKGQCVALKIENIPYPVSYDAYKTKLPEEWLFDYLGKTPSEIGQSKYYVSGRRTTKVVFQEEDQETRMYFDEAIGLPIRIEIVKNKQVIDSYAYEDLSSNTVRDEDVTYRKPSDVPSTEVFYSIYSAR